MEINADLMAGDYRALHIYLHRNQGLGMKAWVFYLGFGFVISVILSVLHYSSVIPFHMPSVITAFVLAFILNYVAFFRQNYHLQRRLLPSPSHPFSGRICFHFNENGIQCVAAGMTLSVAWPTITGFAQTHRHLFFFVDSSTNIVLPKRCLAGDEALGDLQALLLQYCPVVQTETLRR